jgi:ATP-dependent Clp protease adaptor protein ClpS
MKYAPETDIEIIEEEEISVDEIKLYVIVIFNDDVNSFDHVIATLIEVCEHSPEQAEQCTLIIHFKGKCAVKNGEFDELVPIRNAICSRGITAEVLLR